MSDEAQEPEPLITFGVKELLHDIRLSIASVDTKLDNKADKADVAVLGQRLSSQDVIIANHGSRITHLEEANKHRVDERRFKTPLILSLATFVCSPFLWIGLQHVFR